METKEQGKVTYTVGYANGKSPASEHTDQTEAAKAFHNADAEQKPYVIRTSNQDGKDSAAIIAGTSTTIKGNERGYGKSVNGAIDPHFKETYDKIRFENGLRASPETAASMSERPPTGRMDLDGNEVTKISFAKRKDRETGTERYDLAFTVPATHGAIVKELKNLDQTDLLSAVGEKNAEVIENRKTAKGILKGKDLDNAYGLSPEESRRRIEDKEERKAGDMEQMRFTHSAEGEQTDKAAGAVPLGSIPGAMARLNRRSGMVEIVAGEQVTSFGGKPAIEEWIKENEISEMDGDLLFRLDKEGSKRDNKGPSITELMERDLASGQWEPEKEPAAPAGTDLYDKEVTDRLASMWPDRIVVENEVRSTSTQDTTLSADVAARQSIEKGNDELLAVPRDSMDSAAARDQVSDDITKYISIKNDTERYFAAIAIGDNAQNQAAYRAELQRLDPVIAEEAETARAVITDSERQFERDNRRNGEWSGINAQTKQPELFPFVDPYSKNETNSIEPDTEIIQAKEFEAEVKNNLARLQANRESQIPKAESELDDAIENTDAGASLGAKKPAENAIPAEVEKSYIRVGSKYHYSYKPELEAFADKGNKLETKSSGEKVVHDLVAIADARGWQHIKVKGTEEFKRHVWLEASLKGIECRGYKPTEADKAVLESRRKDLPANTIEADRQKTRTQPTEAEKERQQQRKETVKTAVTTAALAGVLLAHGKANFNFDKDEKPNYYVQYRNDKGEEKTVWGVDLERAMRESKAAPGQRIELENKGKQAVTVQAPVKDSTGKVIKFETKETHRNAWEVKADALRNKDAKEAVKEHPDLAGAYAVIKAAEIIAKDKFKTEPDQKKFVGMVRDSLAERIVTSRKMPEVKINYRQQETTKEQQHEKEASR